MSMFSGRIQLKTMDMINTTATTFCAKTDCMIDGKISQIPLSLTVVNPIPTASERDRRQQSDVKQTTIIRKITE
jgi:hypothetical protein